MTPILRTLFLAPEIRFYYDLLFNQTQAFKNVFTQNVSLLFEKARNGSTKTSLPSDLMEIFSNKFEIDLCSLDYQSKPDRFGLNWQIQSTILRDRDDSSATNSWIAKQIFSLRELSSREWI